MPDLSQAGRPYLVLRILFLFAKRSILRKTLRQPASTPNSSACRHGSPDGSLRLNAAVPNSAVLHARLEGSSSPCCGLAALESTLCYRVGSTRVTYLLEPFKVR